MPRLQDHRLLLGNAASLRSEGGANQDYDCLAWLDHGGPRLDRFFLLCFYHLNTGGPTGTTKTHNIYVRAHMRVNENRVTGCTGWTSAEYVVTRSRWGRVKSLQPSDAVPFPNPAPVENNYRAGGGGMRRHRERKTMTDEIQPRKDKRS